MKGNTSNIDRIVRVLLGLVLIYVGFAVMTGTSGIVVGVLGFIPLLTGILGFCPIYALLKISTRR